MGFDRVGVREGRLGRLKPVWIELMIQAIPLEIVLTTLVPDHQEEDQMTSRAD
jgi:hypothetical protein